MNALDEPSLTLALCQALVLKKEVTVQRFTDSSSHREQAICPEDCHACCACEVTLDLTSVEALMIFLLQKDIVLLIDRYTELHEPTNYCPFLLMDKCSIHTYKPTACQMYMPLNFRGEPVCYYLNGEKIKEHGAEEGVVCSLHSNAYAIHGFMLLTQHRVSANFSRNSFKNIYDGTLWWEAHYNELPLVTRNNLESIINENEQGVQQMTALPFEELLADGLSIYNDSIDEHERSCR